MAVRAGNRRGGKLVRVRNMVNRIMMKQRFRQWVASTEYIVGIQDGAELGAKIMNRRRLRNNFHKFLRKVKENKRLEHISKRVSWFNGTRNGAT
jgi:hypothetical protein